MQDRNRTGGARPRPELLPFARWVRERMREKRLGQNQLALLLDVSSSGVSEYVRALRRPQLETLRKMAAYFDVPLADLEQLLPADETPAVPAGYGTLDGVPVADWLTDPDLRVMFYGFLHDLTPEEIESVKPLLWRAYLDILARRGERDAGGDPAGPGTPS